MKTEKLSKLKKASAKTAAIAGLAAMSLLPIKGKAQNISRDIPEKPKTEMVRDTVFVKKQISLLEMQKGIVIQLTNAFRRDVAEYRESERIFGILNGMSSFTKKDIKKNNAIVDSFHNEFRKYYNSRSSRLVDLPDQPDGVDIDKDIPVGKFKLAQVRSGEISADTVAIKKELVLLQDSKELMITVSEYNRLQVDELQIIVDITNVTLSNTIARYNNDKDAIQASFQALLALRDKYIDFKSQEILIIDNITDNILKLPNFKEQMAINKYILEEARKQK